MIYFIVQYLWKCAIPQVINNAVVTNSIGYPPTKSLPMYSNIKIIEDEFGVRVHARDSELKISGEAEFTAKEKDGTVQVKFTFDSSKLKEGSYVVFETLYEISAETGKPEIVGAHWDLEDQAQTVRRPKPPTPPRVRTGDDNNVGMWVIALVAATAGIAGAVVFRRRRFRK